MYIISVYLHSAERETLRFFSFSFHFVIFVREIISRKSSQRHEGIGDLRL